ncbi:MAG: sigma-70 family RNA polymerase sigma factor, partial [Planctomycetota bacterium]
WTERPEDPEWLPDGSFVWQSHRTGPMHLYRYAADGTLIGSITRGAWNVQRVERIEAPRGADDPAGASPGHVWFRATKDGDINSNLYRSDLDGGGFVRLTQGEGTHDVRWNGDRTMFIDRYSSLTNPGTVQVSDADGNVLATVVERAGLPAADETALGRWELHKVPVRDGMVLDAAVLKPADFDPERSYAAWQRAVVLNHCRNQRRAANRRRAHEDAAGVERVSNGPSTPPEALERSELGELVDRFLSVLPPREREAFVLCDLEGMRPVDAAEVMGVADSTVRAALTLGRRRMKDALQRAFGRGGEA